jgi:hypothetical protein
MSDMTERKTTRIQFGLRTLIVLVLILGVLVGVGARSYLKRRQALIRCNKMSRRILGERKDEYGWQTPNPIRTDA